MIVTLTTDFGSRDGYVAAMKGVMLAVERQIRFVDVSHGVAPQDVMEGAFVLRRTIPYFPARTVHLAVVDPGVGTDRRAIAAAIPVEDGVSYFVGPDNGLLSLLLPDDGVEVVELDRPEAWRTREPSRTFHGRDVFAPVAARLAAGASLADVGSRIDSITSLHWALPFADEEGIEGWVQHVDGFGNCITNITDDLLAEMGEGRDFKIYAGGTRLQGIRETYDVVEAGDPVALVGSDGFLEISVNRGNASQLLSIERGHRVRLVFAPTPVPAD